MLNFNFYAPTEVVFGSKSENQVGELCKKYNASKVLIHYGSGSVIKSGLLDRVKKSLENSSIEYVMLGGVVPNPRLSLVREGITLCREENVDFILAVGGGSVIDSAKAIGYGATNDIDVWDLFLGEKEAEYCLPIGTILTIAAAGSEMSGGSVITDDENNIKLSYDDNISRPKFSMLNPELTMTLPNYHTSCGAVDIIMHTFERFFSKEIPLNITDDIAMSVVKNIIKMTPIALADPTNYEARAEIMWVGSVSHNDLTGCGCQSDWATHCIEHTLSGEYDVAHGAGLAAIWPHWARYVKDIKPERFDKLAKEVFGLYNEDINVNALAAITKMEEFFTSIDMPINISGLGIDISDEMCMKLAKIGTFDGSFTLGNFKELDTMDVYNILRNAK